MSLAEGDPSWAMIVKLDEITFQTMDCFPTGVGTDFVMVPYYSDIIREEMKELIPVDFR